jgi:hypothetical protein
MGTFSGNGVLATSVVRALRGSGHQVLVFAGMPAKYSQLLPADTVRDTSARTYTALLRVHVPGCSPSVCLSLSLPLPRRWLGPKSQVYSRSGRLQQ